MRKFQFKCSNCSSTNVYAESDSRISWERDVSLHCYMCGWSLYGRDQAKKAVKKQRAAFFAAEKERARIEAQEEALREAASLLSWEAVHRERQQLRISKGLCANLVCTEKSRKSSTYCSRKCCVQNAHRRERERKRVQKDGAAKAA